MNCAGRRPHPDLAALRCVSLLPFSALFSLAERKHVYEQQMTENKDNKDSLVAFCGSAIWRNRCGCVHKVALQMLSVWNLDSKAPVTTQQTDTRCDMRDGILDYRNSLNLFPNSHLLELYLQCHSERPGGVFSSRRIYNWCLTSRVVHSLWAFLSKSQHIHDCIPPVLSSGLLPSPPNFTQEILVWLRCQGGPKSHSRF